jgi:hypothetical protein
MINLLNATPGQLRKAADIQEQIESLQVELGQILGGEVSTAAQTTEAPKKRKISAACRARMRAAQKARWAAKRGEVASPAEVESKTTPAAEPLARPNKKQVTEAKLKALAKAREARWAKVSAAKRTQAGPTKVSDKSAQEKPKKKRKMTDAWRKALARAWEARRAKAKAGGKA